MNKELKFLVYSNTEEEVSINARVENEAICLTQKSMAELFGVNRTTITRHLKNIFEEKELNEDVVCANFALATQHGAIQEKLSRWQNFNK